MSIYKVHTVDTAPERSRPLLRTLESAQGMIPNLAAAMAESPELLNGFFSIRQIFYSGTFTPAEIQVLALTNAVENECKYCVAFHSALAQREGVPKEAVEALRAGRSPHEPKLSALSEFSRALVRRRGHVTKDDLDQVLAAGYSKAQALEVVLGVAVSILPNYAHHLTDCPLDGALSPHAWTTTDVDAPASLTV